MAALMDLIEQRKALVEEARKIVDDAEAEDGGKGRDLTKEESERSDAIYSEVEALDARIKRASHVANLNDQPRLVKPQSFDGAGDLDNDSTVEDRTQFAVPHRNISTVYNNDRDAYVIGRWLRATGPFSGVACDMETERRFLAHHNVELRVMTEALNTGGGYVVPEVMLARMIEIRNERGVFRRNAEVVPLTTDSTLIPRRTGGLAAYAIGESDSITASDAAFDQVVLAPKKWGTLTRISSDLNEDAIISIADFLTREIAWAFADKEDEAGFNGDGTSTYAGAFGAAIKIIDGNHSAGVFQAGAGDNTFGELVLADFESTIELLPDYALANARWYISQTGFYASMAPILNAGGGNTIDALQRGASGLMFLGFPVEFTGVLPGGSSSTDHASKVACLLGDLRLGAVLGDRRGMTIKQDASRYLEFDQIAVQATTRFDINVHDLGGTTAGDTGALVALQFNTA